MTSSIFESNRLLQAVSLAVRARFAPRFQIVEMARGSFLHHTGEAVEWVYFPQRGLVAILSETTAGETVESGMIGPDGALGLFEACGSRKLMSTAVVRVSGIAARISASSYRELFSACPNLRTAVHKNIEVLMVEARQFVVCNALHSVEARLARAILDALDKSRLKTLLPITQESLAQTLGAQRTTIASQISKLQRKGLIRSGRGTIEVVDRLKLEQTACSCRETVEYARMTIQGFQEPACEAMLSA